MGDNSPELLSQALSQVSKWVFINSMRMPIEHQRFHLFHRIRHKNNEKQALFRSLDINFILSDTVNLGAIHTSDLDRSEIDLNECEHFLKANCDRSQIDPT